MKSLMSIRHCRALIRRGTAAAFLSTHPSHDAHMEELAEGMEKAVEIYRKARAAGHEPDFTRP